MTRLAAIEGRALPIRGDDIDTDRIVPARFLKSVTFDGLEAHLFEDERAATAAHALNQPRYRGAAVMIVNRNFGCGSSREHAAQAIYRHGIRALVGESFSEIFLSNSFGLGMPCVSVSRQDAATLMDAIERDPTLLVTVNLETNRVRCGAFDAAASLAQSARNAFLTGSWDSTGLLRDRPDEVEAVAARLPYLRGFAAP